MRDHFELGSAPFGEDCAQVGAADYRARSIAECNAFARQLARRFPNAPEKARFTTKTFPHDFGSYREVVVCYDDEDEASVEFAYTVENDTPEYWDEQAIEELKQAGFPVR